MTDAVSAVAGSDLYRRAILEYDYGDPERNELMRRVWRITPWMLDCFTGSWSDCDRQHEIVTWCTNQFGPQAFVLGGRPGRWQRGSATIFGWTWMGFETEAMMLEFMAAWPTPDDATPKGGERRPGA